MSWLSLTPAIWPKIRSAVESAESPEFPVLTLVRLRELRRLVEIEVRALAITRASVKMFRQRKGLLRAKLELEPLRIARIARFGAIATIDRKIASSFSL